MEPPQFPNSDIQPHIEKIFGDPEITLFEYLIRKFHIS